MIKWKAIYSDNTSLNQFNTDGSANNYANIKRDKLIAFQIYDDDKSLFYMGLNADKRLIYRRRVRQNMRTGKQKIVYLIGYQQTVNGKNIQVVNHIFDDGHIEQHDTWIGGEPQYYEDEKWVI